MRAEIAAGTDQESQLSQLSDLLGLKESLDADSVPAVVIANGLSNFRYTITINKGSVDGVEMDQPVVTGSSQAPILVGRVIRVSAISAEVELIIDRNSAVAGRLSVSHETGQVQGQGEGDLRMSLVTPGTSVAGDETVVTQGYEVNGQQGLYPPGLVIGQVSHVIPGHRRSAGVRHRSARDRLLRIGVRAGAADVPGRRLSVIRRTLALAAVIVTSLLLQSTVFSQIKLLGVRPELLYVVTILDGDPGGTERGRDRRVRRRHGAGLPPRSAEGHHRAHAHALGLYDGPCSPVHRLAVAALPTILVAVGTFCGLIFYEIVSFLLGQLDDPLLYLLRVAFLSALYSAVLTPLVYPVLRRIFERSRPRRVVRF